MIINLFPILLIIVLSYLLGSLPSAYLIAKMRRVNIFEVGSRNMGATNVSRVMGLKWGLCVWFLDSVKGMGAIIIAQQILHDNKALATTIAAVVAIVGHNWSLFASLLTGSIRGGKGAATAFGTLLVIAPLQVVVITFAISGALIAITRYMSLGVLVMFALSFGWLTILIMRGQMEPVFVLYVLMTMLLIVHRFRDNIQRILTGTERRLGEPA